MALQRLIWARQQAVMASNAFIQQLDQSLIGPRALVEDTNSFNELLALGYMEDDKINVCHLRFGRLISVN
jgi:hypothetical protein